jgi:starch phosphorylase
MTLADFEDYTRTQDRVSATYREKYKFGNMSLVNIAKAGIFSSDRAVMEYAKNIWYMK